MALLFAGFPVVTLMDMEAEDRAVSPAT